MSMSNIKEDTYKDPILMLEEEFFTLVFFKSEIYDVAKDLLTAKDFLKMEHRELFHLMSEYYKIHKKVHYTLFQAYLITNKYLDKVGGQEYLMELHERIPNDYNTDRVRLTCKEIKQAAYRRALRELGVELSSICGKNEADTENLIDSTLHKMQCLRKGNYQTTGANIQELAKQYVQEYYNKPATEIKTGFDSIDSILEGGFSRGNLILLGARPSMGKSSLALNMGISMAQKGYQVSLASIETNKEDVAIRGMSIVSKLSFSDIKKAKEISIEKSDLDFTTDLLPPTLFISDSCKDIHEISYLARSRKEDKGLDFLIVDYLQLMECPNTDSRNLEIGRISRTFKLLASELNIVVLAVCQLSRNIENRPDKRPMDSDLRDSGSLEQDADVTMYIYRDYAYNKEADPEKAEIIIQKNRNGEGHKIIEMRFEGKYFKFSCI